MPDSMHECRLMNRRRFCFFSTAIVAAPVTRFRAFASLAAPGAAEAPLITLSEIEQIDRERILRGANEYLTQPPITITSSSSPRSKGGNPERTVETAARPARPRAGRAAVSQPDASLVTSAGASAPAGRRRSASRSAVMVRRSLGPQPGGKAPGPRELPRCRQGTRIPRATESSGTRAARCGVPRAARRPSVTAGRQSRPRRHPTGRTIS